MDNRSLKILVGNVASRVIWRLAKQGRDIGNSIPVLCYHRALPEFIENNHPLYTILPEQFESHLAFLTEEGFISLSLQDYAEIARGGSPAPRRSVLITFDDGYADNYKIAWPICQQYNIKMNLFISTSLIGEENPVAMTKDGYEVVKNYELMEEDGWRIPAHIRKFPQLWRPLTWQELGEMQDAGVQIGFHSHRHRNLALLRPEEIAADIAAGEDILERRLGYRPRAFALPYGSYTSETLAILRHCNLNLIFAFHPGRARLPSDRLIFPRISIFQKDDLAKFKRKLFGAYDWLWSISQMKDSIRTPLKGLGF